MIRFWYSQLQKKITCGDCVNRNDCKDSMSSTQICIRFKREKVKPEVRIADTDYLQLVWQLSLSNFTADYIKRKHLDAARYGFEKPDPERPTVSECELFTGINRFFMGFLEEQKKMLVKNTETLKILLQTVYSVDEKYHEVRIYSEDKLLVHEFKNYLNATTYSLKEDSYENIMQIGQRSQR